MKEKILVVISQLWSIAKKHVPLYKDGYFWFLLTCLFALLIPSVAKAAVLGDTFWKFVFLDGDIVLFSMVIVTSLMVDNFFFDKDFLVVLEMEGFSDYGKRFLLFLAPVLAVFICLILYLRCQIVGKQGQEIGIFMVALEIIVFMLVAIYAAIVKHSAWHKGN